MGRDIWELYPEAIGNPFYQAFQRVRLTGERASLEHHYMPWDQWFDNTIHMVGDRLCVIASNITARKLAEQRLTALASASRVFAESGPDLDAVLQTVARTLAQILGDTCAVRILAADGLHLETLGFHDVDPVAEAALRELVTRTPARADEGLAARLFRTGEPMLVEVVDREAYRKAYSTAEYREAIERFAPHTMMAAPLHAGPRVFGLPAPSSCSGRSRPIWRSSTSVCP